MMSSSDSSPHDWTAPPRHYGLTTRELASGRTTFQAVCQAAQCLLAAELDLSATAEERVAALTNHVALMRQFEQEAATRLEAGILPVGDDEVVRYWRLRLRLSCFAPSVLQHHEMGETVSAELGTPPNGGPVMQLGNSVVTEGPPSAG